MLSIVSTMNFSREIESVNEDGELILNTKKGVMLKGLAGEIPDKCVISAKIAENAGFEVGCCYMVKSTKEKDDPKYGSQFSFVNLGKLESFKLIEAIDYFDKIAPLKVVKTINKSPELSVKNQEALVD